MKTEYQVLVDGVVVQWVAGLSADEKRAIVARYPGHVVTFRKVAAA